MHDTDIDGGTIRKLWIGETDQYRDHLLRLDPASRRNRFSGAVSDDFIARYVGISNNLDTVIHGYFFDGMLRGVAELRPLGAALPQEAEVAFSIEASWQSHGVGTALLDRTLLAARNRGFKLLHMACLLDNRRMQRLAKRFSAALTFDYGCVVGEVEAPFATPLSVMREIASDAHGIATAVLDVQCRLLRPA